MGEKFTIDIDVYPSMRKLDTVEAKRQEVEEAVEKTEEESKISFNQVMALARTAWVMTSNIVRASGGTIDTVFRLIVQTAISGASVIAPLLTATAATPGGYIQAMIGFSNLMIMTMAIGQAQKAREASMTRFRAAQYTLMSAANILSFIPSLWK